VGEPLYDAGIERGDLLTRVNGVALDTIGALERALDGTSAGDSVQVDWTSWSGLHRFGVLLIEHPALTATPDEILAGATYTAEERAFRERWLSSRAAEITR
jgi:predicted metalloprotease with PDZ domain